MNTHESVLPTRRRALAGMVLAAVVAALAAFGTQAARPAEAGLSWCGADPLITVDGHALDITAYVPLGEILSGNVDGPVVYLVHLPRGSRGNVLLKPDLLVRQEVRFVYDQPKWNGRTNLAVPVDVTVKAKKGSFDFKVVGLNLALRINTQFGESGETLRFNTAVKPNALLSRLTSPLLGLLD